MTMSIHGDRPVKTETSTPTLASGAARTTVFLVGLGTVGGLLFTIVYLCEGLTRVGYSTVTEPISALSLGPGGWLQRANFITFGALVAASAIGWRRLLQSGTSAMALPAIRAIVGIGLIVDGLMSQDAVRGYPPGVATARQSLHGTIHNATAFVVILGLAIGSFLLARRLRSDPDLHAWAPWSVVTGLLTIMFITAFGMSGGNGEFAGIFERLSGVVNSVFGLAFLICLFRFTRRESLMSDQDLGP